VAERDTCPYLPRYHLDTSATWRHMAYILWCSLCGSSPSEQDLGLSIRVQFCPSSNPSRPSRFRLLQKNSSQTPLQVSNYQHPRLRTLAHQHRNLPLRCLSGVPSRPRHTKLRRPLSGMVYKWATWWAFGHKRCFAQTAEYVHSLCYRMPTGQVKFRKWSEVPCTW
jgi:hypothetical protein